MHRRRFLKWGAALAAAGVLPPVSAARAKEAFTVYGAPALPTMTIAVAALQGRLAKQAAVSVKTWRSPDQLRAGVAGGTFKVMMSPSNVGVNLRNQGRKVGMVNILTNGIIQLVGKGKAIAHPRELAGKRVIIPFKNDMPDIVFQALLKKLGIDARQVHITYAATGAEAVGLFLSRNFDAALVPEPLAAAAVLRGKTMGVNVVRGFDVARMWGQAFGTRPVIPQAGLIADTDFYRANKAKFDLFHQDLKNALVWINANRQSAAEIGKNYLAAPVPAIVSAIPHANLTVTKGSELKNGIMAFYEELMRFNPRLLGGRLPDDGFFL
ncbi:ABC transporter substrate-binding protein [Neisseria sp.]|uniref:ABC transporter substrate-binding protein n=1 Tax=Neisseria sp. TaxID=192066 RepID=UPI0026DCBC3E|nr:twin-arginine translocation signal domain-containing protein [Neisseria sp.]MDO4907569.1 twin-arginine translocation signal domain-containing protein [Neisseria sp.]